MSLVVKGSIAAELCSMLTQYPKILLGEDTDATDWRGNDTKLTFETKYYNAEVDVTVLVGDDPSQWKTLDEADAFIYVVTTEEAIEIEKKAEKAGDGTESKHQDVHCDLSVEKDVVTRVLVVAGHDATSLSDKSAMFWATWAIDRGFEYIYMPKEGRMATAADREKESLPRLMEALESTQWRSMQPKGKDGSSSSSSSAVRDNVFQSNTSTSTTTTSCSGGGDISDIANPFLVGHSDDDIHSSGSRQAQAASADSKERERESTHGSGTNQHTTNTEEEGGEGDNSDGNVGFEQLLEQAMKMRESVASGALGDAERRAQAERFATQFAAMLDFGEGGDSSDDDDDDGGGGGGGSD